MKSTAEDLRKRGMASKEDIASLSNLSYGQLITLLKSDKSYIRSAAALNLYSAVDRAADEFLNQLLIEKCLYSKIAICEGLEKGNAETVAKMICFLGKIGNNQHRTLPKRVSAKKSFPLPRDIIARSLARMNIEIFPVLIDVLKTEDIFKIREVLDAVGFMTFYNQELSTCENLEYILRLLGNYKNDEIIIWKVMLCLSAFRIDRGIDVLEEYSERDGLIGKEAQRSLKLLNSE